MAKLKAVVTFDYKAEAPDELTLKVGEILTNIKHVEEGWCRGELNGKTGMFPDNFVKMEEEKPAPAPTTFKRKKAALRLMKCTFSYDPQNSDELKLEVGDIVEVLDDEEEGWAKGRLKGKEGVFPTNFCALHTENEVSSPTSPKNVDQTNGEVTSHAAPKKVKGIGFGNIFGEGQIKLKKTLSGGENEIDKTHGKSAPKQKIQAPAKEKTEKAVPSAANKKAKVMEKCRVTFDYQAQTADELTLVKGDIITILNKNCEDPGWWEGERIDHNGKKKRGVFPDNFVALLPAVDEEADHQKASKPSEKVEEKAKVKHTDSDKNESKPKNISAISSKAANMNKRPAPQVPPVSSKPNHPEPHEIEMNGLDQLDSPSEEKQLTHYKRPVGPKNRRKPDATGRRERARESMAPEVSDPESEPEVVEAKVEEPEVETEATSSQIASKRKTMMGVPVMPTVPGGAGATEGGGTPNWLQQLKSRNSTKRESAPLSVAPKPDEPVNETPDWRANLRKNTKPADGTPTRPPQPVLPPNKPMTHFQSLKTIPTNAAKPDTGKPAADEPAKFKPAVLFQKSKSEANVLANAGQDQVTAAQPDKPAEVKKPPARPQAALQPPPVAVDKKPVTAAKPKPPPAKSKPALPASKPASSVDEMKDEVKSLREHLNHIQIEHKKEISRLNNELEAERNHRLNLQSEIDQLRKRVD